MMNVRDSIFDDPRFKVKHWILEWLLGTRKAVLGVNLEPVVGI